MYLLTLTEHNFVYRPQLQIPSVYSPPPEGTRRPPGQILSAKNTINDCKHTHVHLHQGLLLDADPTRFCFPGLPLQIPSLCYTPSPEGSILPTGQILSARNTTYDFTLPLSILISWVVLPTLTKPTFVYRDPLQIPSLYYTPSPEGSLLPTGQILSAKNTIYDFTQPRPIRKDYAKANGGPYKGFDLNYVMPDPAGSLEPVWWKPGVNPQVGTAPPFLLRILLLFWCWRHHSRCVEAPTRILS